MHKAGAGLCWVRIGLGVGPTWGQGLEHGYDIGVVDGDGLDSVVGGEVRRVHCPAV